MLMAIDSGNWEVKCVWENGYGSFNSCLGEGRQRNLKSEYPDEMIVTYKNQLMFAGSLAEYESAYPRRSFGITKAHEDGRLRTLIAICRFGKGNVFDIVVGQPIRKHTESEKNLIINMLKGEHKIELNGVKKEFEIRNVTVTPEGAAIYWTFQEHSDLVRIVDIGSGTINIATIRDGFFVDKESTTLPFGTEVNKIDNTTISHAINSALNSICDRDDEIYVAGGKSVELIDYIKSQYHNCKLHHPYTEVNGKIEKLHPKFATAVGLYNLGRVIYT